AHASGPVAELPPGDGAPDAERLLAHRDQIAALDDELPEHRRQRVAPLTRGGRPRCATLRPLPHRMRHPPLPVSPCCLHRASRPRAPLAALPARAWPAPSPASPTAAPDYLPSSAGFAGAIRFRGRLGGGCRGPLR